MLAERPTRPCPSERWSSICGLHTIQLQTQRLIRLARRPSQPEGWIVAGAAVPGAWSWHRPPFFSPATGHQRRSTCFTVGRTRSRCPIVTGGCRCEHNGRAPTLTGGKGRHANRPVRRPVALIGGLPALPANKELSKGPNCTRRWSPMRPFAAYRVKASTAVGSGWCVFVHGHRTVGAPRTTHPFGWFWPSERVSARSD